MWQLGSNKSLTIRDFGHAPHKSYKWCAPNWSDVLLAFALFKHNPMIYNSCKWKTKTKQQEKWKSTDRPTDHVHWDVWKMRRNGKKWTMPFWLADGFVEWALRWTMTLINSNRFSILLFISRCKSLFLFAIVCRNRKSIYFLCNGRK